MYVVVVGVGAGAGDGDVVPQLDVAAGLLEPTLCRPLATIACRLFSMLVCVYLSEQYSKTG
jgi:hypothetical protein